jgi:hypothetical protein
MLLRGEEKRIEKNELVVPLSSRDRGVVFLN